MRVAYSIVEKTGREHPFSNGMAGRAWFDGFRSRNPNLTMCISQPLSYFRATATNKETIDDFFAKLGAIYTRLNLLSKPMQIFETGISVVHKTGRVICQIGCKNEISRERENSYSDNLCFCFRFCHPTHDDISKKKNEWKIKARSSTGDSFECSIPYYLSYYRTRQ